MSGPGRHLALYAKARTTGDMSAHLEDVCDQVGDRATISRITDGLVDDM